MPLSLIPMVWYQLNASRFVMPVKNRSIIATWSNEKKLAVAYKEGTKKKVILQFLVGHFVWIHWFWTIGQMLPAISASRLEPASSASTAFTKELSRSGIDAATNLGQAYENQSCNLEKMAECSYFGCLFQLAATQVPLLIIAPSFKSSGTCSKLT